MKNEKQLSFPSPFGVISISIIQRRLDAITAMGFRPLSGLSLFQFLSAKTSTVAGRSFRPLSGLSLFQYRVYGGRKYGCVMFPSPFGVISISIPFLVPLIIAGLKTHFAAQNQCTSLYLRPYFAKYHFPQYLQGAAQNQCFHLMRLFQTPLLTPLTFQNFYPPHPHII